MCIGYRSSNKIMERNKFPLNLIEDDNIEKLKDRKYFSLVDLKDGFSHIKIAEESIKFTSFITPVGQFDYLYLPFGIKNSPPIFKKIVNSALSDLIDSGDLVVYMDAIFVPTRTLKHHLEVLQKLFKVMVENKLEIYII